MGIANFLCPKWNSTSSCSLPNGPQENLLLPHLAHLNKWFPHHPPSCSSQKPRNYPWFFSFSHHPTVIHQQILLAFLTKYIPSMFSSLCLHGSHLGPCHCHLRPGTTVASSPCSLLFLLPPHHLFSTQQREKILLPYLSPPSHYVAGKPLHDLAPA